MEKLKNLNAPKKEIPFAFDLLFKKIFGDENNINPFRTLIKRTLNINPKVIEILNVELINRPYKDQKNAVDLIVQIDEGIKINIEINTSVDQSLINRNVRLLCLNMSKDLEPGATYREIKSQKQLNFDLKGNHPTPIESYSLMGKNTHTILTDTIEIIRYDVPYFKKLCYTNDINKLDGLSRLIGLFGAETKEEVEYICRGDEELEEIQKQYEKYTNEEDVIGSYDYELHQRELARVEREQAVAEAIEETTKQRNIEIAKNMLNLGLDIETISKATGLDIETIKGLQ